jgi:DNA-binding CsgD family transcriptional regulator
MSWPVVETRVFGAVLDVVAHVYGGTTDRHPPPFGGAPLGLDEPALVSAVGDIQRRTTQAAGALLLDRLPFALLAVDAEAHLAYANESAMALLAAGDRIRLSGDRVSAARDKEDGALLAIVAALTFAQPAARTADTCQLTSARDGRPFGVLAVRAPAAPDTVVLLLADPAREHALRALLRSLFALTRAEAELCLLLLQGFSLDEAARERHVSPASARATWQAVSWKTGGLPPGLLFQLLHAALALPLDVPSRGTDR